MNYKRRFVWLAAAMILSLMVSFPALSEDLADTAGEPLFLSSAEDSWDSASEIIPGEEEAQFPDASAFVGMAEDWVAPAFPASEEEPLLEEETIPSPSRITAVLKPGASLAYGDPVDGSWTFIDIDYSTPFYAYDYVIYSFDPRAILNCISVEAVYHDGTKKTIDASDGLSVPWTDLDKEAKATLCRIEYQEVYTEVAIPTITLLEKYPDLPLLEREQHISYDPSDKSTGFVRYYSDQEGFMPFVIIADGDEEGAVNYIAVIVLDGYDTCTSCAKGIADCDLKENSEYCILTFPLDDGAAEYTIYKGRRKYYQENPAAERKCYLQLIAIDLCFEAYLSIQLVIINNYYI